MLTPDDTKNLSAAAILTNSSLWTWSDMSVGNGYFSPLHHAWGTSFATRLAMRSISFSESPFGVGPQTGMCVGITEKLGLFLFYDMIAQAQLARQSKHWHPESI